MNLFSNFLKKMVHQPLNYFDNLLGLGLILKIENMIVFSYKINMNVHLFVLPLLVEYPSPYLQEGQILRLE
jgi:hypothetical protein